MTANSASEISLFTDKIFKYEKDPPTTNYPLNALLIGMDTDSRTHCENLKELINDYIPSRFTVTKVYESDSGNHETAVKNALNAGQNLVNHADHASETLLGVGSSHGWYLNRNEVDALTNNNQMSIVVSLGCHPNDMDYSDCIAEHFVIKNSLQAGIAFTGNTGYGYYYEGQPDSLSGRLDKKWWIGLFDNDKYIIGETLDYAKDHFTHSSSVKKQCEWNFNLLGEPSMPIWTDTPKNLDVTHPSSIPTGSSSFSIHVEKVGGGNIYNASVCLWKDNEVYETGYTNYNGDITFSSVAPSTTGTLLITVTAHNYIPYEGSCTVTSGGVNPTPDIKINGQSNPPDYPQGTTITVTVSLDPGSYGGILHDWWIYGVKDYINTWWWQYPGTWIRSSTPILAIQHGLLSINNHVVYKGTLPIGNYTFYFAIDAPDGIYEGTYIDSESFQIY